MPSTALIATLALLSLGYVAARWVVSHLEAQRELTPGQAGDYRRLFNVVAVTVVALAAVGVGVSLL